MGKHEVLQHAQPDLFEAIIADDKSAIRNEWAEFAHWVVEVSLEGLKDKEYKARKWVLLWVFSPTSDFEKWCKAARYNPTIIQDEILIDFGSDVHRLSKEVLLFLKANPKDPESCGYFEWLRLFEITKF